jgi:hypothetical protein
MRITALATLSIATAATAVSLAASAHADPGILFQTPSRNIACEGNLANDGKSVVTCEIQHYTWFIPRPADYQLGGLGNRFILSQGSPPVAGEWYSDFGGPEGQPTLDYGHTQSLGSITCDSEPSGVTCTDASTGHFFTVSGDSYHVG